MLSKRKVGIGLIIISFIFFFMIPIVPFVPLTVKMKVILTTTLAIIAEVTFWIGGFFVGKEVIQKYKKYLNPSRFLKKKGE
jgi:hypothetical protein